MALTAIGKRYSPKKLAPLRTKPIQRKLKAKPLFDLDLDDEMRPPEPDPESDDDDELAFAIQESFDQTQTHKIPKASPKAIRPASSPPSGNEADNSHHASSFEANDPFDDDDDEGLYAPATRLETALAIGNAGPSPRRPSLQGTSPRSLSFGQPVLLQSSPMGRPLTRQDVVMHDISSSDNDMEEVTVQPVPSTSTTISAVYHARAPSVTEDDGSYVVGDKMAEVSPSERVRESLPIQDSGDVDPFTNTQEAQAISPSGMDTLSDSAPRAPTRDQAHLNSNYSDPSNLPLRTGSPSRNASMVESDEEILSGWSRSPSPTGGPSHANALPRPPSHSDNWDAAQEMDPHAEEGEYARFMSQVKGRDIDTVRKEIDDEIKALNQQRKAAMRDSEDVTQQMISQIMVCCTWF
jgi:DNA excision repair protein ERCC-5